MQKDTNNREQGLIKLILLVVIGLIVLRFVFEFDVVDYVSRDEFLNFARGAWKMIVVGWQFIIDSLIFLWQEGKELVLKAVEIVKGWVMN